jgi:hypothetical protein
MKIAISELSMKTADDYKQNKSELEGGSSRVYQRFVYFFLFGPPRKLKVTNDHKMASRSCRMSSYQEADKSLPNFYLKPTFQVLTNPP